MGAEAWRKIEGTGPGGAPASAARRRRSQAETLPASDPSARLVAARPDWCVDEGDRLLTMSTFELWAALEHADVLPWMRVWREGMECWTPVGELPEFAWAIATTPRPASAPRPASSAAADPSPPAPAAAPAAAANDAAPPALRPSPPASLPEITPAPVTVRSPADPRGTRWVALGSAIAVAALGLALMGSGAAGSAAPLVPAAAVAPAAIEPAATAPAAAAVMAATAVETSSAEPPAPALLSPSAHPAVRRDDRGQRRLPRGGRRPVYGR
jgi:hypothetical protein